MKSGVYVIKNASTDKVYVGSTIDLVERKRRHFRQLEQNKHRNQHLQNAYNKYGADTFDFSVMEYCDRDVLLLREEYYVRQFNSLDPSCGFNLEPPMRNGRSDETKKKISVSLMGHPGYFRNKKLSDEHKNNISKGGKGTTRPPVTDEWRIKQAIAHTGIKQSDETRRKRSISLQGRIFSEEHKRRLSESQKGREITDEHRRNLSIAQQKRWQRTASCSVSPPKQD